MAGHHTSALCVQAKHNNHSATGKLARRRAWQYEQPLPLTTSDMYQVVVTNTVPLEVLKGLVFYTDMTLPANHVCMLLKLCHVSCAPVIR